MVKRQVLDFSIHAPISYLMDGTGSNKICTVYFKDTHLPPSDELKQKWKKILENTVSTNCNIHFYKNPKSYSSTGYLSFHRPGEGYHIPPVSIAHMIQRN